MSHTELLLFVSLLGLLALVRVMRKFSKNALVFWGWLSFMAPPSF